MEKNKPFWHRLTKKEHGKIMSSGITVAEVLEKYRQPTWCNYHEAISGMMGCWSLYGDNRTKISHKFCQNCDLYTNKTEIKGTNH